MKENDESGDLSEDVSEGIGVKSLLNRFNWIWNRV
jgi:hypothetical protein